MKESAAINALRQVKDILDKSNIEYWLDEGTLLGAVREKSIIAGDHDIDLAIWSTTITEIIPLFNEIGELGIKVYYSKMKKLIKLFGKGYEIDINIYFLKDGKATKIWQIHEHSTIARILDFLIRTSHLNLPNWLNKQVEKILSKPYLKKCRLVYISIPSHFFINFSTIKFYTTEFRVPANTEKYLGYRYGKDWRIPKRDYVYYTDDGAISKN